MNNEFEDIIFSINEENSGQRIDKVILSHEKIASRSQATKLFKMNLVSLGKKTLKPSYVTKTNDQVLIKIPKRIKSSLQPFAASLEIIHQDEDIIVINKPPGLVMHPSAGHQADTLVNALIHLKIELSMGFNEERPGIVHRIDKDTSGLVVVAKNNHAHEFLARQFHEKQVHRVYNAIVYGEFKNPSGVIENYLVRHPVHRKKFTIERLIEEQEPKGKKAVTNYHTVKSAKGLSLVECRLKTGRTHQIRVHMSENQHPIISDPIYSSSRWLNQIKSKHVRAYIKNLVGIGLHARELGFVHPRTGEPIKFNSPWPDHLIEIIQHLGWQDE